MVSEGDAAAVPGALVAWRAIGRRAVGSSSSFPTPSASSTTALAAIARGCKLPASGRAIIVVVPAASSSTTGVASAGVAPAVVTVASAAGMASPFVGGVIVKIRVQLFVNNALNKISNLFFSWSVLFDIHALPFGLPALCNPDLAQS